MKQPLVIYLLSSMSSMNISMNIFREHHEFQDISSTFNQRFRAELNRSALPMPRILAWFSSEQG